MSFIPLDSSHPLSGSPFETTSLSHPSALTHRFTQSLTVSRPPPSLSLSHSLPAPLSRSASGLRRSRRTLSRSAVAVAASRQPLGLPSEGEDGSLAVDFFTFSSSIADHLRSASLVISHAGSGSIFETLRLGKPLIVVVNEDLMDNHQSELAEELAERKHLYCARPQTLQKTVAEMSLESLLPYPTGDAKPVANLINHFLGFQED